MDYELSPWQLDYMMRSDEELLIACTGVGAGKSRVLAVWLVVQCINKPGIRGILIAQTRDSLKRVLVREIETVSAQFGVRVKVNRSDFTVTFPNKSILMCYSAGNPTGLLGLSEIALLAIDEAAYCPEEVYNYAMDRMRGSKYDSQVRLISSPVSIGVVNNWFSELCKKYPDKVIHASTLDNSFTNDKYKKNIVERYEEGTNIYRQQVLGEILDVDVASQIIFRNQFPLTKQSEDDNHYFGMDASGMGADSDMYVVIDKFGMVDYKETKESTVFEKANIVTRMYDEYKIKGGNIDLTGGYGQGCFDFVTTKGYDLGGINFAQKAIQEDKYPNVRTEMYMELAKAVKDGFWVNDEVREELLAQSAFINNRGLVALLPKEDVKKILGHSPDLCDAVALAVYAMNHGNKEVITDMQANKLVDEYLMRLGYGA